MKKYTPLLGILSAAHTVMAALKEMVSTVLVGAAINVRIAVALMAVDIVYPSSSLIL